jgi:hypothetical protein
MNEVYKPTKVLSIKRRTKMTKAKATDITSVRVQRLKWNNPIKTAYYADLLGLRFEITIANANRSPYEKCILYPPGVATVEEMDDLQAAKLRANEIALGIIKKDLFYSNNWTNADAVDNFIVLAEDTEKH